MSEGADLGAFMQLVEGEVGGKLAPTAEGLAQRAFEKALNSVLEKLADEALKASVFASALDVG